MSGEEYGKRQAPRRKSLDAKNLRATKEQKKERKVRGEIGRNCAASQTRIVEENQGCREGARLLAIVIAEKSLLRALLGALRLVSFSALQKTEVTQLSSAALVWEERPRGLDN